MQRRLAVSDRNVKLVDDFDAENCRRRERIETRSAVLVNHYPNRHGAQVGALAAHDDRAEVLVRDRLFGRLLPVRAAIVARTLERGFLGWAGQVLRLARIGLLLLSAPPDPAHYLVRIEVPVPAIRQRRERTVFER